MAFVTMEIREPTEVFAKRLTAARLERGWSVSGLARELGIGRPNLRRLEVATGGPHLATLHALASALDIPMSWLVGVGSDEVSGTGGPSVDSRTLREAFGGCVRFTREARCLTQDEVGLLVGVTGSSVSHVERNGNPQLATFQTYCEALAMPPEWALLETEDLSWLC